MQAQHPWANITRRDALKRILGGALGFVSTQSLSLSMGWEASARGYHAVVVRHPHATDGQRVIQPTIVRKMVDNALQRLTGKPSSREAWSALLTNWQPRHLVALKVNAIPIGKAIPTHPEVVDAIIASLNQAGVPANRILVYDQTSEHLAAVGYRINQGTGGVRCFGTNTEGWGYDWSQAVDIAGQRRALSRILTRCDHLINVPVLKVHLDPYGVTLSLKNHYGSVDAPRTLHTDFAVACAALNAQRAIRDKTRLVVVDALFGCWGSHPARWVADCAPNSLILSRDPVAADALGTQMLNEERRKHGVAPRKVPLLAAAASLGLGICHLEERHISHLELKTAEEGP